jgi:tRNA G26 N,N-dimethylase Trm1
MLILENFKLVWTGLLHDKNFVQNVIKTVNQSSFTTKDRIEGMLQLVMEEIPNPLYYVFDDVSLFQMQYINNLSIKKYK